MHIFPQFSCLCVCVCLSTDVWVCVCVWEHVIWVQWYTHTPCVGALCMQSDGVWARARTKLCAGGLSLRLKSALLSNLSGQGLLSSPQPWLLTPNQTHGCRGASPPRGLESGEKLRYEMSLNADGPIETRTLWSHKNESYGQTAHLLEWPSFWWSVLVSSDFYGAGNSCLYIHGVYGQYNRAIPHNRIIRIMRPCSVIPPVGRVFTAWLTFLNKSSCWVYSQELITCQLCLTY